MKSLFAEVVFTRLHARFTILACSLIAAVLGLLGPFFQKEFIDQLTGTDSRLHFFQFDHTLAYILGAFFCILLAQAFTQLTNFLSVREALYMQKVFAKRLYDKTLNLRVDTMSGRPVGEIVSLYATDVQGATVFLDQTLPAGASMLFPLILAPFAISLLFDVPLWPTIAVMLAISCLNTFMAFRQSRFFFNFKQLAAERIGLVNEWIQNIRTIRILSWTHYFEKNIFAKRVVETRNRVSMVTNGQMMNSIATSITFFLNAVALASLVFYSKHQVTSGELLALLWIVGVFLTRPFRQMPWFFTFGFDSWTSLRRLEDYFSTRNNTTADSSENTPVEGQDTYALQVRGLNLTVSQRRILRNVSLDVAHGEFVAVVGEVGAGKSMLLLSLLKETGARFESYYLTGKNTEQISVDEVRSHFAYVPQEGFIMNATLRENVAFIYDIEAERDSMVEESLRLAQFDLSTERVEKGLNTEIGERGVNLSGGQRQRVGLARVHYHEAPIMLLDDCLSAVDVDTEQKLFEQLLLGAWADRTRILVTHRLSALNRVDRILFMEEGQIIDSGTFEELLARSEKFRAYTTSVAKEAAGKKAEAAHV
ncbi:ABC transporter ATP-binding protein/permease [Bdellovibrio bacteriovorus]|uniref:ABC transporter ATP-binding protein n=1 Tax=Bdellovibrio bacteriovorus TaxID=959 RepID=UPI0021CEA1AB|nr:ABC transporter ATP-binding protein/permease [Bdellovibrio bacteriovorus]UXR63091.1 ABC transporter ATP-binding protein/permease [Bdellovibrio bacteriovorus]